MSLNLLLDTQPLDIWHDTVFQLIVVIMATLLSAFIGGAIAIWVYRQQKSKKEITYQIVSDAPIASINQAVADKVEMRFDGKPIKEARLVVLKVGNTGNTAIVPEDYDEPVMLKFEGNKVLNYDILKGEGEKSLIDPRDEKRSLKIEEDAIVLPKIVFNPKDTINFSVILEGPKNRVRAEGRIINGKKPIEFDPANLPFKFKIRAYVVTFTILIAFSFFVGLGNSKGLTTDFISNFLSTFFFFSMCFIFYDLYIILRNTGKIRKNGVKLEW